MKQKAKEIIIIAEASKCIQTFEALQTGKQTKKKTVILILILLNIVCIIWQSWQFRIKYYDSQRDI